VSSQTFFVWCSLGAEFLAELTSGPTGSLMGRCSKPPPVRLHNCCLSTVPRIRWGTQGDNGGPTIVHAPASMRFELPCMHLPCYA